MTFLIRWGAPSWIHQEYRTLVEDALDTFDERQVGIAAYNCIKRTVLESLTNESLEKYQNYKINNKKNEELSFKDNIKLEIKPDGAKGYFFDIFFYINGVKYNFTLGICRLLPGGIREFFAGFDTNSNTLYLPFLVHKPDCQIDCETIEQIEETRGTIIHEIKHKMDSLIVPPDEFDKIPDPANNTKGYYNHHLERHAYGLEMIDFVLTKVLRDTPNHPEQLNAMCNDDNVYEYLNSFFEDKTNKTKWCSEMEFKDMSNYYIALDDENKKELAKQIAEYYRSIIKPKLEQTKDKNEKPVLESLKDAMVKLYQQK